MLFNSYLFIFLFLPLSLAGYFGLNHIGKYKAASAFLFIMSLCFCGYANIFYPAVLLINTVLNYGILSLLSSKPDRQEKKFWLFTGILLNAGILLFLKYYNFFTENINTVFQTSLPALKLILPLGISFYTFQQISCLVDIYRGDCPKYGFLDYALSISFFPKLTQGPIALCSEIIPELQNPENRKLNYKNLSRGIYAFALGLAKKVLIADSFAKVVNLGFGNIPELNTPSAALVMVCYSLQIYFDFSGYCDMALGLGRMLGIEIPVNFNSPYKAVNIVDFWKRWHITLNRFFTKYVYIPLGGNRKGQGRMYVNLLIVFFLSGFWHGAGFHFLVWGMLHGVLYVATRFWLGRIKPCLLGESGTGAASRMGYKIMTVVSRIATFFYVSVAWVYFRAESITQANTLLWTACAGEVKKISLDLAKCLQPDELWYVIKVLHLDNLSFSRYILMFLILAAGLYFSMVGKNAKERVERLKYGPVSAVVLVVLAVWCILSFSGVSTFLYFNF